MTTPTAHDIFWLARYAHNTLNPLFEQAKSIEPSIQWSTDITFGHEAAVYAKQIKMTVSSHWGRDNMFQMTGWLVTKADVDQFAAKLAKDVAALQPLEVGIAA